MADIAQRREKAVDIGARQVAHRRGAAERNDQIGAGRHADIAQGEAEVAAALGHAPVGGDIENSDHADDGVDQEAPHRVAGIVDFALHDVIGGGDRTRQVGQHIMNMHPHRIGNSLGIIAGGGQGGVAVQPLVDVEEDAVDGLQRIVGFVRCGAARQHRAQRQGRQQANTPETPYFHSPTLASSGSTGLDASPQTPQEL